MVQVSWHCETCKTTRYRVESNLELPFQCDCGAIISSVTVDRLDAGPFITQAPSQYSLTNATNVTNNGVSNMHETCSDCKNEINGSHFHGGYNDRVLCYTCARRENGSQYWCAVCRSQIDQSSIGRLLVYHYHAPDGRTLLVCDNCKSIGKSPDNITTLQAALEDGLRKVQLAISAGEQERMITAFRKIAEEEKLRRSPVIATEPRMLRFAPNSDEAK